MIKLLFVIPALVSGGAEKSLVTLLKVIDYSKYQVDLFMLSREGLFFRQLDKNVNLIELPDTLDLFLKPLLTSIFEMTKKGEFSFVLKRIKFAFVNRWIKNISKSEFEAWKILKDVMPMLEGNYDVAISFLEKTTNYLIVDKVDSKKKIGWIHIDYVKHNMIKEIDEAYFKKLDTIFTVSEECRNVLQNTFPHFKNKFKVMYNIVLPSLIQSLANENNPYTDNSIRLLTVGRLSHQKGYEMAIRACRNLIDDGYKIKWYVIGEGEEEENLKILIKENNLEENFILFGTRENPYPYVKNCDIYVQPSRFEGKSIAIDEAKILKKPIVVTNFSTVKDQIKDGENGIIAEMNSKDVYSKIKFLLENQNIMKKLSANLEAENIDNSYEINKLYEAFN